MLVGKMIVKVVVSLVHLLAVGALSVLFFMITFPVPFQNTLQLENISLSLQYGC